MLLVQHDPRLRDSIRSQLLLDRFLLARLLLYGGSLFTLELTLRGAKILQPSGLIDHVLLPLVQTLKAVFDAGKLLLRQIGFVFQDFKLIPGRTIFQNVWVVRDLIAYANEKELKFLTLAMDQEKAFDRVSHEFIRRMLRKLGAGEFIGKAYDALYADLRGRVVISGKLSPPFRVTRGVRQGCPFLRFCLF